MKVRSTPRHESCFTLTLKPPAPANALVAVHQAGIKKVDLGRLQHGAANVVVPGTHHKHDEQRLQNVEVSFEPDGRMG